MKKHYLTLLCLIVIYSLTMNISAVYAHEYTDSYSWYLQYGEPNTAPRSVDMSQFGEKHHLIWLDKSGSGKVYLTFDVGYDDGNVEPILDALKKHGAKGAFFVLPNFIKSCPELIERMNSEGHLICNHTTHHKDMSKVTSKEAFAAELADIENLYREQTGHEMAKFFRPPEGKFSENTLKFADELGYKTVFWSLAHADWDKNKQPDPQKALEKLLSRIHDGSVVLLHPTSSTNAKIMDDFLAGIEAKGYGFASLDEFPSAENGG